MAPRGKSQPKAPKDFAKTRRKVGKAPAHAANATRTTFRSKAIVVPDQAALAEDKGAEETSARHLTLRELLGQMRHYNVHTRRDAVLGLRDLLARHAGLAVRHLADVLSGLLPLMTDLEGDVRHAMLLAVQALLPLLQEDNLVPFVPLFKVYCTSALTHVSDDVRLHAVATLNAWLAAFPHVLARESRTFLPLFLYLLTGTAGGEGAASGKLLAAPSKRLASAKGRMTILASLCAFLEAASASETDPLWFTGQRDLFAAPAVPDIALQDFASLVVPSAPAVVASDVTEEAADSVATPAGLEAFLAKIMPVLLDCWLEYAPMLSTSGARSKEGLASVQTLKQTVRVVNRLWRLRAQQAIEHADAALLLTLDEYARDVLRHFILYFPFEAVGGVARSGEMAEALAGMSTDFADTLSLLLLSDADEAGRNAPRVLLRRHVVDLLSRQPVETQVLAVCWRLLRWVPWTAGSAEVLRAVVDAVGRSHVHSQQRHLGLHFLATLFLSAPGLFDAPSVWDSDAAAGELRRQFFAGVPQTLWELGTQDARASTMLLHALTAVVKQEVAVREASPTLAQLQKALIPFFSVWVSSQRVRGPFCALPSAAQRAAAELVFYLPRLSLALAQAISGAVQHPTDAASACYVLHVVALRLAQDNSFVDGDRSAAVAFYLSAAVGYQMSELAAVATSVVSSAQPVVDCAWSVVAADAAHAAREAISRVVDGAKKRKREAAPVQAGAFWAARLAVQEVAVATLATLLRRQRRSEVVEIVSGVFESLAGLAMPADVLVALAQLCAAVLPGLREGEVRSAGLAVPLAGLWRSLIATVCDATTGEPIEPLRPALNAFVGAFPWVNVSIAVGTV